MVNFHEHTLWQQSYVALMDIHQMLEDADAGEHDEEVVEALLAAAQRVTATIADSLTRKDNRVGRELLYDAVGQIAMTRTHLAVAWGRGLVDDDTFKSLDDKYAALSEALQNFK